MIREDESSRFEVLVSGEEDGIEHGLVKEEVAHPFRDNDIEFLDWEDGFFELAFYEGDLWEL